MWRVRPEVPGADRQLHDLTCQLHETGVCHSVAANFGAVLDRARGLRWRREVVHSDHDDINWTARTSRVLVRVGDQEIDLRAFRNESFVCFQTAHREQMSHRAATIIARGLCPRQKVAFPLGHEGRSNVPVQGEMHRRRNTRIAGRVLPQRELEVESSGTLKAPRLDCHRTQLVCS